MTTRPGGPRGRDALRAGPSAAGRLHPGFPVPDRAERSRAPAGAVAALEPEPEPGPCGAGESPPAGAMRAEPPAWAPGPAQAAALLEEAADLLVLHRDFAAAVERCEAGCDSLGPGPCPGPGPGPGHGHERCGRVRVTGWRWDAARCRISAALASNFRPCLHCFGVSLSPVDIKMFHLCVFEGSAVSLSFVLSEMQSQCISSEVELAFL